VFWGVSEFLINCIKWVLPGLLLFDGCRTRRRTVLALVAILSVYFLLALQVIKHMPLSSVAASGAELSKRANKILAKSVGYHRVNLSMMLSGASWAILTTLTLVRTRRNRLLVIGAAGAVALGQALTGGRAGYVTWGLLGTILCLVRWRSLLPVLPITILAVCILLPSVRERMLQGFTSSSGPVKAETDVYEVTSGRNIAWSYVIPKIYESPIFGYGRQAMIRTGTYRQIMDDYDGGETFPHPHNAYLECLFDNGVVGFILIIPFYLVVLWHAFKVLLDRSDALFAAIGGTACALVLALLIAAMGSQSFYPREGSVGMWAAIGLLLRVSVERSRSRAWGTSLFGENETESNIEFPEESPQPV
jgi:O-antigen ligase